MKREGVKLKSESKYWKTSSAKRTVYKSQAQSVLERHLHLFRSLHYPLHLPFIGDLLGIMLLQLPQQYTLHTGTVLYRKVIAFHLPYQ